MTGPLRRHGLATELAELPDRVPAALRQRARDAEAPFLVGPDVRLSFDEADRLSTELAGRLLASGIGKGTRVGLREAFVFGIPAGARGDDVAAVVVPEGPAGIEPAALTKSLRETLSSYKVPRHIRIVGEASLPKLATGKVDLPALRQLFRDG